jgi:hypothetical protein
VHERKEEEKNAMYAQTKVGWLHERKEERKQGMDERKWAEYTESKQAMEERR